MPKPTQPTAQDARTRVQSLDRAFQLLEIIAHSDTGIALAEAARHAKLPPSTVHRLLNSMAAHGFVEFDPTSNRWGIGVAAFRVGNAYLKRRDMVLQARPYMRLLMDMVGETCNLGIIDARNTIFISQVECKEVMRMAVQLGSRGPLHATGVGKAILSTLPRSTALDRVAAVGFHRLTAHTITHADAFSKELDTVRHQGYAIDNEEQSIGLRCVAANIFNEYGDAIAAVSVSGPTVRLTNARLPDVAQHVVNIAEDITRTIGGVRPDAFLNVL